MSWTAPLNICLVGQESVSKELSYEALGCLSVLSCIHGITLGYRPVGLEAALGYHPAEQRVALGNCPVGQGTIPEYCPAGQRIALAYHPAGWEIAL